MDSTSLTLSSNKEPFIEFEQISAYCGTNWGENVEPRQIEQLAEISLLPLFVSDERRFVLKNDLVSLRSVLSRKSDLDMTGFLSNRLFEQGLEVSPNCHLEMSGGFEQLDPAFYSAARNLLSTANQLENSGPIHTLSYFPPTLISTSSPAIVEYVKQQKRRAQIVGIGEINDFAGTAHYMGSKRLLSGFLVEALSPYVPTEGVIVDLMCGSGAASRAFSQNWRTIACDLQEFCTILAAIQGGGFSSNKAQQVLQKLLPIARGHARDLTAILTRFVLEEDGILHSDAGPNLLTRYRHFLDYFPTYPSDESVDNWHPKSEVERRKTNPKEYPYCLFSSYFANVFFGIRQCIEIDSLRFAIDQLQDEDERTWSLGALITTASALGTTYGAHFAQPKIGDVKKLDVLGLSRIIEQRAYSIVHEFTMRLMNLAEESGNKQRRIETVKGPWQATLNAVDELLANQPTLVYVDAPYKRDEYSRYYHLLETLVSYSYPQSLGKGRLPEKGTRERPASEFFTRSRPTINKAFVSLISSILERRWTCAWSYASSGNADMVDVLAMIQSLYSCEITSYATPYEHKAQGKAKAAKRVTEYLVVITPDSKLL